MRKIWKYHIWGFGCVTLPKNATVLKIGVDGDDKICAWALVDLDDPGEEVDIAYQVYATGDPIPHNDELDHVGTVITKDGLVFHFFKPKV